MKLVTYINGIDTRLGAVQNESVIDLLQAWTASGAAGACPLTMEALLQGGDELMAAVAAVVGRDEALTHSVPLETVRFASPVTSPSKIICVGLNYRDHCVEQHLDLPKRPLLFAKFPSTLIGHEDKISWPEGTSREVDYEAELAVVIGRKGRHIPEDKAYDYVAGYACLNDVSARDVQLADEQWTRGKSFDTFCPLGPYLVTKDEVPDPHSLGIRCLVNGELRQQSNTRELIFDVPFLLAYISQTATLLPGDIISTGTPGGVGFFLNPPVFLEPGDVVEVDVDRIGRLRNQVA